MKRLLLHTRPLVVLAAMTAGSVVTATVPDKAEQCVKQFLERDDAQHEYRAIRRLEAENGDRRGWLEAVTEYSRATGFSYEVTVEGGSGYIRNKVLRGLLEGEQEAIAKGTTSRSSIATNNYAFTAKGIDPQGLAAVQLLPRRKDHVLIDGTMFLHSSDGDLVRLEGRLAKSPSFWVRNVEIVRQYERIAGANVPVSLESKAEVRLFGAASLKMTYDYLQIDGRPVAAARAQARR